MSWFRKEEPKLNLDRDLQIGGEQTSVETDIEKSSFKSRGRHLMPAREVFTDKEMNRLEEVRKNSPEQENNNRGRR